MKPKVIIFVLDTEVKNYQCLKKAQLATWVAQAEARGYDVIYYRGGSKTINYDSGQRTLNLPCDDFLQNSALKLFETFKYFNHQISSCTYVFRTNLSSYINIERFGEFIDNLAQPLLYGGVIGKTRSSLPLLNQILRSRLLNNITLGETIYFASGSGFILSSHCVSTLLKSKFELELIDDVAVGKVMNSCGVFPSHIPRIDLYDDYGPCDDMQSLISTSIDLLNDKNAYHYRIKGKNKIKDASLFYLLDSCEGDLRKILGLML